MDEEKKEMDTPEENQWGEGDSQEETPEGEADDIEKIKKERDSAIAQKEHYRGKYDKAKSAFEEEKKDADTPKETADAKGKLDFLVENMGSDYTKEDVELISKQAKLDGVTLSEAAKDKDISDIINQRHKKAKEDAKSLDSNFTNYPKPDKPLEEMTPKEHQAYEEKLQRARKNQM